MKAYSTDLRQKIIEAYQRGQGTQRAIAELFGVSVSFVEKLLQRYRTTGNVAAKAHGGGQKRRLDATDDQRIRLELPRFRGQLIAWHSSRLLVAPLEVQG